MIKPDGKSFELPAENYPRQAMLTKLSLTWQPDTEKVKNALGFTDNERARDASARRARN